MLSSSDLPEVTGGEDQRHAVGKRTFDMFDRAGPFDLAERRVDDEKLVARDDAREQDRHRVAVLAAAVVESDESFSIDQFVEFAGDGNISRAADRQGAAHASNPS